MTTTTTKSPMAILIEPSRKHNGVDKLERFGDVTYLFSEEDRRPPLFAVKEYGEALAAKLLALGYQPTYDYLVMSGSSNANYILLSTLIAKYGTVKVLMWHSGVSDYTERAIGRNPSEPAR